MASKKTRPFALKQAFTLEIHEPAFALSKSLRYLDPDALSKVAKAEIPVGEIDGGCCRQTVFAVIRKGRVTGIRAEECPKDLRTILPRAVQQLMAKAIRRLQARRKGPRLPMPVTAFLASPTAAQLVIVQTLVCLRICILGVCITCCRRTDIPNAPLLCGRVTIDTTTID